MTDHPTMSNPGNFLAFAGLIKRNRARLLNPQQLPLHIAPESSLRDDEYWPSRLFSILSLLSTFHCFRFDAAFEWCSHHRHFVTAWRSRLPPAEQYSCHMAVGLELELSQSSAWARRTQVGNSRARSPWFASYKKPEGISANQPDTTTATT
jgi:hypothetical protein